ncbi:MAG: hypothetical protein RL113_423 [Pseudomonadota bacterium]
MLQRTAIIDIGSNSARLVIFEKTSTYGFHLICEQKSKVRIGEGAYHKEGYLQPIGIKRAYLTLKSFIHTIKKYRADKTICVATSALRDAPNGENFVQWIKKELALSIDIIDGHKEAFYGGIAAVNLLPISEGISVDIGGGSSDMSLIQEGQIIDTYTLNLGTVRLKELFFDTGDKPVIASQKAMAYIKDALQALPEHFKHSLAIGIGGTARTLAKGVMKRIDYPLDKLHAFSFEISEQKEYLQAIPLSSAKNLKHFGLKKNRYDTIREGTLIFNAILEHIEAKEVISSAVGVREGLFLNHLLKSNMLKFPIDINPSMVSILDRFKPLIPLAKNKKNKLQTASTLYDTLQEVIGDHGRYQKELSLAVKLSSIGKTLTIYRSHQHAFYIAMQELNYGLTHREIVLISMLLRMHGKSLLHKTPFSNYIPLLPQEKNLLWLNFIYALTILLHEASHSATFRFHYDNKTLRIISDKPLYLTKEKIKTLQKPIPFAIIIEDEHHIPSSKILEI